MIKWLKGIIQRWTKRGDAPPTKYRELAVIAKEINQQAPKFTLDQIGNAAGPVDLSSALAHFKPKDVEKPKPLTSRAVTVFRFVVERRAYRLIDAIKLSVECGAVLQVEARIVQTGTLILRTTVVPKTDRIDRVTLLGLHQARAEQEIEVEIRSACPFDVYRAEATYMNPPFRREQNEAGEMMCVFYDSFYAPVTEEVMHTVPIPHSRLAAADDVRYN